MGLNHNCNKDTYDFTEIIKIYNTYKNIETSGLWKWINGNQKKLFDAFENNNIEELQNYFNNFFRNNMLSNGLVSHNLLAPDFLWIDVQGAEYNVLRGGIETLKKTKAIYTEYSLKELYEGQKDLWFISNYLKDAGFKLEKRFKDDALFCRCEPFPFA